MSGRETKESLFADLLSSDENRIWRAAREVMSVWDEETLSFLVAKRDQIEAATNSVGLSEVYRSYVEEMLDKLAFFASPAGHCRCELYPMDSRRFDPRSECDQGRVRIVRMVNLVDPDYRCECTNCGTQFDVHQSADLTTWWRWSKVFVPPPKEGTLADFLSRDADRISSAAAVVIRTWNEETLGLLAAKLDQIEAAMNNIQTQHTDIPSWTSREDYERWAREARTLALEKLKFFASRAGCLCETYPKYVGFNPEDEVLEGHIKILRREPSREPDGRTRYDYVCECLNCGARYDVVTGVKDAQTGLKETDKKWTMRTPGRRRRRRMRWRTP